MLDHGSFPGSSVPSPAGKKERGVSIRGASWQLVAIDALVTTGLCQQTKQWLRAWNYSYVTQSIPIICSQQVEQMWSSPRQLEVWPCILRFALTWILDEFRRSHCDATGRDNYNCTKNCQTFQVGELLLQLSQIDWPEHLSESNRWRAAIKTGPA